jgi:hypothetical protein
VRVVERGKQENRHADVVIYSGREGGPGARTAIEPSSIAYGKVARELSD